jgi:hypothetical protein
MRQERQPDYEEALVRAFLISAKQQRWLDLLAKPKRRLDVLKALAHFSDLDPRYSLSIPAAKQSTTGILELLRAHRAPVDCHLLSENTEFDQRTMPLADALNTVVGMGFGTLIPCVPGRLGYYEGEEPGDRRILVRRAA